MLDHHAYTVTEGARWNREEERERMGRFLEPIGKREEKTVSDAKQQAIDALLAFAQAHERWEANLILSNEAWNGGAAEFPRFTQELYEEFMEIQRMRNAAVEKATEAIA